VAALAIALAWRPAPYVEQLIRIQAKQELGHIDRGILDEPVLVQATLLDYAGDQELLLKAWIALSKYQETARAILLAYGAEPEFKEILRTYGDAVIPVIQYFRENDVWTVKAMHSEGGWAAVQFIKHEGHDFLGQFVVDKEKKAKWNQTDRIVKALTSFFTSGVRDLEKKHDLDESITAADVFWASLDVALVAVPAKLLLSGKAVARSGTELNLATRTRLVAPRLVAEGNLFRKLGTYGAAAVTVYIVATHPSLLNSVFAELAELAGISPWIVQLAGWWVVIALAIYVVSWLLRPVTMLARLLLKWIPSGRSSLRT
jgi:hypothetical protein